MASDIKIYGFTNITTEYNNKRERDNGNSVRLRQLANMAFFYCSRQLISHDLNSVFSFLELGMLIS